MASMGMVGSIRAFATALVVLLALLVSGAALAAPEAHILRVDPRASVTDGAPILTTVVELVQQKRMSDITSACAEFTGNEELDCISDRLEKPRALYSPFKFPDANALFTITVDGADQPATHVSTARWGSSKDQPGVGTAWLLLIDASSTMGDRFEDARVVARAFVDKMGPQDIVDVMFFNDGAVVRDSRWMADKRLAANFVDSVRATFPAQGRTKSLFKIIKQASTDGFKELGNVGTGVEVPMHQAMVLMSDGSSGTDPGSAAPTALGLRDFVTKGRFPEDNTTLPKTPLPLTVVWFPRKQTEELFQNARQFMENLANPEIGGGFYIVRAGQSAKGPRIAQSVNQRYDEMHIVKWRVACISPTVSQTYKLVFKTTDPVIAGDNCVDCPTAIDPTTWPLDVDVEESQAWAKKNPIYPGGKVRVFGNFCWGTDHGRAELYLLPKNQPPPDSLEGKSVEEAKQFQKTLIEAGLHGKSTTSDSTFVEFEIPDTTKFLIGSDKSTTARLILWDGKAKRTSAITADKILTVAAQKKPLNLVLIGGVAFGGVVLILLVVGMFRGGSKSRRRSARATPPTPTPLPAPAPFAGHAAMPAGSGPAGHPQPGPAGHPQPAPLGQPYPGLQPYPAPAAPMSPETHPAPAPALQPPPYASAFEGGGHPGAAGHPHPLGPAGHPHPGAAGHPHPLGPAGHPHPGLAGHPHPGARRVLLHGTQGSYPVPEGRELRVGRDPGMCEMCLTEARVSGMHATVKLEGSQLMVRDDGSNNGTYIGGNKISSHVWQVVPEGTPLRFGPVEFTVRFE